MTRLGDVVHIMNFETESHSFTGDNYLPLGTSRRMTLRLGSAASKHLPWAIKITPSTAPS